MTEWELRYKSPLAPNKGVDDVIIATDEAHEAAAGSPEAAAKQLGDHYLSVHVSSPTTRFISVRRCVVATSADMRRELGIEEPKSTPAKVAKPAQTAAATGAGADDDEGKKDKNPESATTGAGAPPATTAPTTGGRGRVGA